MCKYMGCIVLLALTVSSVQAEQANRQADIKLLNGAFQGQVYTQAGQLVRGTTVQLYSQQGKLLGSTQTGKSGEFGFQTAPGVYLLQVAGHTTPIRVWNPSVAPPAAGPRVLVTIGRTARGNGYGPVQSVGQGVVHGIGHGLGNVGGIGLVVVGGTIATVVAVSTSNSSGS